MTQYEFIAYKPTPSDQYMLGVATVRLYGKVILRYKHVKTKDGTGDFFTSPSYSVSEDGEKKYLQAFLLDSRSDEEQLQDLIRRGVKAAIQAARNPVAQSQSIFDFSQGATGVSPQLPFPF